MTEPLNEGAMNADEVVNLVKTFLTEPVRLPEDSDCQRSLTHEELRDLYKVFHAIIDAKYEWDYNQSQQIDFTVADRTQDSLMYVHIPHNPEEDWEGAMRVVEMASGINELAIRRICGRMRLEEADKREAAEWLKKCENLVRAAQGPLQDKPVAQILMQWAQDGKFYTGKFSTDRYGNMWEPLGLTVEYVDQAYHDREDRDQPFEAINTACIKLLEGEE